MRWLRIRAGLYVSVGYEYTIEKIARRDWRVTQSDIKNNTYKHWSQHFDTYRDAKAAVQKERQK